MIGTVKRNEVGLDGKYHDQDIRCQVCGQPSAVVELVNDVSHLQLIDICKMCLDKGLASFARTFGGTLRLDAKSDSLRRE